MHGCGYFKNTWYDSFSDAAEKAEEIQKNKEERDLFWCGACEYQICRGCQASLSPEYKVVCANGRWRCREHR